MSDLDELDWLLVPGPVMAIVRATVANPRASSDHLILLAEAIDEAACTISGATIVREEMRRLADVLRAKAPTRAPS